jgi:hypothetical protein
MRRQPIRQPRVAGSQKTPSKCQVQFYARKRKLMKVYINMFLLRLKVACKVDLGTIYYADYFTFTT